VLLILFDSGFEIRTRYAFYSEKTNLKGLRTLFTMQPEGLNLLKIIIQGGFIWIIMK